MTETRAGTPRPESALRIGLITAVGSFLTLASAGALSIVVARPLVVPSLGPTLYLAFEEPLTRPASPRNTLIGHFVAIVVGWLGLAAADLVHAPPATVMGMTWPRAIEAAFALGLVALILRLIKADHPPAGATVLIVALGILNTRSELLALYAGVVLITAIAWVFNRAVVHQPVTWSNV